ncbi:MAG: 2-hydroxyethylphosphonate methyltransferase [Desulfovibrio sp.]
MKNKNVLLVIPPQGVNTLTLNRLPMSVLYLAGALRAQYRVGILDLSTLTDANKVSFDAQLELALSNALKEYTPFFIGISCLFAGQSNKVKTVAQLLKQKLPEVPVVLGGIHATIFGAEILHDVPEVDFVLKGEAEESILALLTAIINKEGYQNVDGLVYRDTSGHARENPKQHFIHDLTIIPQPAYDLIDFNDYCIDTSDWNNPKKHIIGVPVPLLTSRSCPNRCCFCAMYHSMGSKFRARPAWHVADEMELLVNNWGTKYFEIFDDNFTLSKKRTLQICNEIIRRKLDIQFQTTNGVFVNSLDAEVIEALAAAGMARVSLAIESGSDYMRNKVIGKHLSKEKIYEVCNTLKKYPDIKVNAFFILGMPEETHQTMQETYTMMQELPLDSVTISTAIPFPGTAANNTLSA